MKYIIHSERGYGKESGIEYQTPEQKQVGDTFVMDGIYWIVDEVVDDTKVSYRRILELAFCKAVDIWEKKQEDLQLNNSEFNRARERKAHKELNEISALLYKEEHKA